MEPKKKNISFSIEQQEVRILLKLIKYILDAGNKIEMPQIKQVGATFKKAEKYRPKGGEQLEIKED